MISWIFPAEDFDTDANKENKDEREALLEKYEKDPNVRLVFKSG